MEEKRENSNASLVECVPNFSEGRRSEIVEAIIHELDGISGVKLLDYSMDKDHNRSVVTFVGTPAGVVEGAFRTARKGVELINLEEHQGSHPRIGAVDVVPFIPVSGVGISDCVKLAHALGERIFSELKVPVYFYEEAALKPERKNLAEIRKGNYEGLKQEIALPHRHPDVGGPRLHPTAGATVVGARQFLVAFNVNLSSPELKIAREIARRVREKDGGLKNVKAMGVILQERNQAQVSMNLVNCSQTPIYRVVELIKVEAARYGVTVAGTEVVGLVPLQYVMDTVTYYLQKDGIESPGSLHDFQSLSGRFVHYLQLEEFESSQILETRLHE